VRLHHRVDDFTQQSSQQSSRRNLQQTAQHTSTKDVSSLYPICNALRTETTTVHCPFTIETQQHACIPCSSIPASLPTLQRPQGPRCPPVWRSDASPARPAPAPSPRTSPPARGTYSSSDVMRSGLSVKQRIMLDSTTHAAAHRYLNNITNKEGRQLLMETAQKIRQKRSLHRRA
jgi:hypothetical protein